MSSNKDRWLSFSERFNSFDILNRNIYPDYVRSLAEAGFYLDYGTDRIICFSCNIEITDWLEMDEPFLTHFYENTKCPFLRNNPSLQKARNSVIIHNHLNNKSVLNLVKSGQFSFDTIEKALYFQLQEFETVPQTLNGVIYVTKNYVEMMNKE